MLITAKADLEARIVTSIFASLRHFVVREIADNHTRCPAVVSKYMDAPL
jgi:hypothetical protein